MTNMPLQDQNSAKAPILTCKCRYYEVLASAKHGQNNSMMQFLAMCIC